jgi:hypothetical protein
VDLWLRLHPAGTEPTVSRERGCVGGCCSRDVSSGVGAAPGPKIPDRPAVAIFSGTCTGRGTTGGVMIIVAVGVHEWRGKHSAHAGAERDR